MEKSSIQKLVSSDSDRVTYLANPNTLSQAWDNFAMVHIDKEYCGYLKCLKCDAILAWKKRDGTSGLINHSKACFKSTKVTNNRRLTDMGIGMAKSHSSSTVPASLKSEMSDELATMCAIDIRPFTTVEGQGFRSVARKLISIGAQYGNVSLDDVLPVANTVARHSEIQYNRQKEKLQKTFTNIKSFGVTTDLWTYENRSMSFMAVNIHYMKNWSLKSCTIAAREMDDPHTGINIQLMVKEILDEFKCSRSTNTFVTDNASNMKSAFSGDKWLGCAGHNINLVLSNTLTEKEKGNVSPEIKKLLETIKQLVTLIKRTKLNNKLTTSLKQSVPTRWNSILTMLNSVQKNMVELKSLVTETANRNVARCILDINEPLLENLISVLSPFDTATKVLSSDTKPTLQLVLPTRYKLIQGVSIEESDSSEIRSLKSTLSKMIDAKFNITLEHQMATILDPRMKSGDKIMNTEQRQMAIEELRKLVNLEDPDCIATTNQHLEAEFQPPRKKSKLDPCINEDDFLGDLLNCSSVNPLDELDSYLKSAEISSNILDFWKMKSSTWPKLSSVAAQLLSIPATSTSAERCFSTAGRTLEDRRSRLSPESVDHLLFLNSLETE